MKSVDDSQPSLNGSSVDDTTTTTATESTLKPGERVYVSMQGDWWDMIAMRAYGLRRGNEHLMYRLIEANYPLREVSSFPAGLAVIVPKVDVETIIPLVPWKNATRSP